MSKGMESQRRIQEALAQFEAAVVHREHKKMFESEVPLQQEVDRARSQLLEVVAQVVTEQRVAADGS
jgi:hypothetical protein